MRATEETNMRSIALSVLLKDSTLFQVTVVFRKAFQAFTDLLQKLFR